MCILVHELEFFLYYDKTDSEYVAKTNCFGENQMVIVQLLVICKVDSGVMVRGAASTL